LLEATGPEIQRGMDVMLSKLFFSAVNDFQEVCSAVKPRCLSDEYNALITQWKGWLFSSPAGNFRLEWLLL